MMGVSCACWISGTLAVGCAFAAFRVCVDRMSGNVRQGAENPMSSSTSTLERRGMYWTLVTSQEIVTSINLTAKTLKIPRILLALWTPQLLHGSWRSGMVVPCCPCLSQHKVVLQSCTWCHFAPQELLCGPMVQNRARIVVLQPESASWSNRPLLGMR